MKKLYDFQTKRTSLFKVFWLTFILVALIVANVQAATTVTLTTNSVSATQTGTLVYGSSGSATYTMGFTTTGNGGGSTTLTLNWTLPTGCTIAYSSTANGVTFTGSGASRVLNVTNFSPNSFNVTLTITSVNSAPAVSTSFTVSSSTGSKTSSPSSSFIIGTKALTVTANNSTKVYGQTQATPITGSTAFNSIGLVNGETIGSVTLNYGSGALDATAAAGSTSTITASAATGGTFNATNYNIAYTANSGTLSVIKAPLSITAIDDNMEFDGVSAYSGGNDVTFDSFVNSETSAVLGGSLTYGGTSQGASNIGSYTIIPSGYTSSNYDITFHNGTLTITAPGSVSWNGNTSTDWGTATNWTPSAIPVAETSVTINDVANDPIISPTTAAECNDLTLASGATLTINSDGSNSGSLIAHGTTSGNVTYNRYMTGGRWYITSAPVVTSDFGTTNESKIVSHGNPTIVDYDFATYTETENAGWDYKTTLPESLTPGQGFLVTLAAADDLTFTGPLNADPVNISVANTGTDNGWNAVGNPYTSAIKVVGTGGFLEVNSGVLASSYAAVYVWNETGTYTNDEQYYKAISNSGYVPQINGSSLLTGVNNVQAGQGFLINAGANSNVSFTKAMQVSATDLSLKSAETSWPGITLLAEANGKSRSTVVAFNEQMTTGLDVTFDAGLLASDNFQVYTHLVGGNNDVDFAIQCLPDNQYSQLSVPVGLDLPEGGDLVFKASGVILRDGLFPVIEDRLLGIQTALKTATDSYTVTLDKNTSGIGRFYLSVADVTTSKPVVRQENKYTASLVNNRIVLNGAVEAGTKATLYDICGRKVGEYPLAKMNRNEIPVSGLSQRVYLLKVEGSNYRQVIKLLAINY